MQGAWDAKTLGSELRRQYAKRNRAQVMIDFLETSGIGSNPVTSGRPGRPGQSGRPDPAGSYNWRQEGSAFEQEPRERAYANKPAYLKRGRAQNIDDEEVQLVRIPSPNGERYSDQVEFVNRALDDQLEEER